MEDDEKAMLAEVRRAVGLIEQAVVEIELSGGSLRFFASALFAQAAHLVTDIEGPECFERVIGKIASRELQRVCQARRQ